MVESRVLGPKTGPERQAGYQTNILPTTPHISLTPNTPAQNSTPNDPNV